MTAPLHPNLARLASQYDQILVQFQQGRYDARQARREIEALHARDDEGVIWTIDVDTGAWMRKTLQGDWVAGSPPTSGLATPTAFDLSRDPTRFNPDSRIHFEQVPDVADGLVGATRTAFNDSQRQPSLWRRRGLVAAAILITLGVVAAVIGGDPADAAVAQAALTFL